MFCQFSFIVIVFLQFWFNVNQVRPLTCYKCTGSVGSTCDVSVNDLASASAQTSCDKVCRTEYFEVINAPLSNPFSRSCALIMDTTDIPIPQNASMYCENWNKNRDACICQQDLCNGLSYEQLERLMAAIPIQTNKLPGRRFFTAEEAKQLIKAPWVANMSDDINDKMGGAPAMGRTRSGNQTSARNATSSVPRLGSRRMSMEMIVIVAGVSVVCQFLRVRDKLQICKSSNFCQVFARL
ncbi:uncharacterized protein LOC129600898 isoform X2 [Paramacrobiotus metropolitanus]|uniref:uncharacterized protein LOC129600898 isoform X2 n=1 Tax=Paramacrobiotus metropolitanus TaxID=2943436 RepID=UPI0024457AB1|nr:uncharacterized protein LOC129600898 isoform X2 [Paramacrobiotus metropolitanus]